MNKANEGLSKSTFYYRKTHPKVLTFTEAAKRLGITRQSVHRTARKIGVTTAQEVLKYYEAHRTSQVTWEIILNPN